MGSEKVTAPITANMDSTNIDSQVKQLASQYLAREKLPEHRAVIESMLKQGDELGLQRLLGRRLQFGTAGIRGRMGPGYSQMNDLVVIQTAQGIASYLIELDAKLIKEKGVIIGHDARHNSKRFARLVALAFLQKSIPVYYNDYIVPTPFVAFGVKHFACRAGIMVTASHNPKEDNGIKVFWHNGCQILSPHDTLIEEHIQKPENLEPWHRAWEHKLLEVASLASDSGGSSGMSETGPVSPKQPASPVPNSNNHPLPQEWTHLLRRIYRVLNKEYFSYIESLVQDSEQRSRNKSAHLTITYTAMHGVGHIFMTKALEIGGFEDIFPVDAQKRPNPDFTTVRFPNPEEAGALELAFETAKNTKSNLILANDPDSDRCAVALYEPATRERRILNGNEIGALLGWWAWFSYKKAMSESTDLSNLSIYESDPNDANILHERAIKPLPRDPANCYMISTAVSSKFLKSMAQIEGFTFVETLTGFKYMGNVADEIESQRDKCVLFAYEEAIGYMVNSIVLDKDGISACLQMAQCAAHCLTAYHRSLEEQLDWLYTKYGYHYSLNSYYICADQAKISDIFNKIQANYPRQFQGGYKVRRIRDLNRNYDSSTKDLKATLPSSLSSYMVTFFIDGDITLTFRTSGTEPKIKYYSEIVAKFRDSHELDAKREATKDRLRKLVSIAVEQCLEPRLNDLEEAETS